jgi:hypothetical protein
VNVLTEAVKRSSQFVLFPVIVNVLTEAVKRSSQFVLFPVLAM